MNSKHYDLFKRPTLQVARKLLGWRLTTAINGETTSGMIVEVEAYHQIGDAACHCYSSRTPRNELMFSAPGHCYIYKIYGIHHCFNVVTESEGVGAAVLIRAVEPIEGIETMKKRRRSQKLTGLVNGPGKLCEALGIDMQLQGKKLGKSGVIKITPPTREISGSRVATGARIGISKAQNLPWRFYIKDNIYVGRHQSARAAGRG